MKTHPLLTAICGVLLLSAVSSLRQCHEVKYDHYQLSLTWPTEYCSEHSCSFDWKSKWDGKTPLIHGFWPSSKDLAFLTCLNDPSGHDPYCYHEFAFSKSHFNSSQLSYLEKYWPIYGNIKNFWSYEWDKHGTCYLHIIKDQLKSQLSTKEIFREYMLGTVDKVQELKLSLQKGKKYNSKKELANDLNLWSSEFYAICGNDNELDELRICYDVYSVPGREQVFTCPESRDRAQCSFPMQIK